MKINMKNFKDTLKQSHVFAIIRGVPSAQCIKVADSLYQGGIRIIEIAFDQKRPDSWGETAGTITAINRAFHGKLFVGAGTVTSEELVLLTVKAGGKFVVSPDTNINVIGCTKKHSLISIPGAMTPTEILSAHRAGADYVKLFPAGKLGADYIKDLCAPINHIPILAVGGVDRRNMCDFLSAGGTGVGVGGHLIRKAWVEEERFDLILEEAKTIVAAAEQWEKQFH